MEIRGILINTRKGVSKETIEYKDYTSIVELLECDYITCVTRNIGGALMDVYCDEEYLLKQAREPAIFTRDKNGVIVEILYGNCFICSHNRKGEIKSLTHHLCKVALGTKASVHDRVRKYEILQATIA